MIEIIALIFLCRSNAQLAVRKGLKPGVWKLYTVLAWLCAEGFGAVLGLTFFVHGSIDPAKIDQAQLFEMSLIALFCGFGGYLLVRYILEQKPDAFDDINNVGVDDLKPPVR